MRCTDEEANIIAKSLAGILRTTDNTVLWTDFLKIKEYQLIVVGFVNGNIKFANVTGKNPFKAAIFVMKCLEEIAFDEQFLMDKQLQPLKNDIEKMFDERNNAYDEIMEYIKKREISCYELSSIIEWGQSHGYFPEFIADIKGNPLLISGTFEQLLNGREISTYDLLQFREKIRAIKNEKQCTKENIV